MSKQDTERIIENGLVKALNLTCDTLRLVDYFDEYVCQTANEIVELYGGEK